MTWSMKVLTGRSGKAECAADRKAKNAKRMVTSVAVRSLNPVRRREHAHPECLKLWQN